MDLRGTSKQESATVTGMRSDFMQSLGDFLARAQNGLLLCSQLAAILIPLLSAAPSHGTVVIMLEP